MSMLTFTILVVLLLILACPPHQGKTDSDVGDLFFTILVFGWIGWMLLYLLGEVAAWLL